MIAPAVAPRPPDPRDAVLRARAQELEGQFLSEMLRHSGVGAASGEFSGGIGEEQFKSFLRESQAQAIAARGGIGLAEHLFNALRDRLDARPG